MNIIFLILFSVIVMQRLIELVIASSNERWLKKKGGIEKYHGHYKWFIIIHSLFFVSIILETNLLKGENVSAINYYLLLTFIILQVGRIWCIKSLGRYWNTKIIVLPNSSLVKKGPYKYVRHPNYIIVGLELLVIPLLFGAYITAIIFPVLHMILLMFRIPLEEKALNEYMNYKN